MKSVYIIVTYGTRGSRYRLHRNRSSRKLQKPNRQTHRTRVDRQNRRRDAARCVELDYRVPAPSGGGCRKIVVTQHATGGTHGDVLCRSETKRQRSPSVVSVVVNVRKHTVLLSARSNENERIRGSGTTKERGEDGYGQKNSIEAEET